MTPTIEAMRERIVPLNVEWLRGHPEEIRPAITEDALTETLLAMIGRERVDMQQSYTDLFLMMLHPLVRNDRRFPRTIGGPTAEEATTRWEAHRELITSIYAEHYGVDKLSRV